MRGRERQWQHAGLVVLLLLATTGAAPAPPAARHAGAQHLRTADRVTVAVARPASEAFGTGVGGLLTTDDRLSAATSDTNARRPDARVGATARPEPGAAGSPGDVLSEIP